MDNPLKDKILIEGLVIFGKREDKLFFYLPDSTGPYVARLNKPLTGPRGAVIEGLEGWRLRSNFFSSYFLFEKEGQVAAFMKRDVKHGSRFDPLPSPRPQK